MSLTDQSKLSGGFTRPFKLSDNYVPGTDPDIIEDLVAAALRKSRKEKLPSFIPEII